MIDDMLNLCEEMHAETLYKTMRYDRSTMRKTIEYLIERDQFVHYEDGCVMLGTASQTFFGPDIVASDVLMYVSKDKRGKGLAKRALSAFKSWAESKGAKMINVGQTTGVTGQEFNALAEILGFSVIGKVYGA